MLEYLKIRYVVSLLSLLMNHVVIDLQVIANE